MVSMNWAWRAGLVHMLAGSTILFGLLHPLRDLLAAHELHVAVVGSSLQAIQGVGLLMLSQLSNARWPAMLIAAGTACYSLMLYFIVFTGKHPFDPVVPVGGAIMLLGWLILLVSPRSNKSG